MSDAIAPTTTPIPTEAKQGMSDEALKALNRRIEELTGENAELKAEAKSRRIEGKKLKGQVETITKERDTLVTDRDGWKTKAEAKSPELTSRIQELEGKIRTDKHQLAFNTAAQKAGIDPASKEGKQALADLWTLSGYKAEGDEPDPAKLDELMTGQKEARPLLFGKVAVAEETGTNPPQAKPKLQLPLDNSRGPAGGGDPQAFKVTTANLQDLGWMQQNASKFRAAKEAGTIVYE